MSLVILAAVTTQSRYNMMTSGMNQVRFKASNKVRNLYKLIATEK